MLPYCGHPAKPDDACHIVVQPDMRFFLQDCKPRDYMDIPGGTSSSSASQQPGEDTPGEVDFDIDAIATNREGLSPAMTALSDQGLEAQTPELMDLMRIRTAAKAWTEFNPDGQAEFIWVCYNTSPCLQTPDGGEFLRGWVPGDIVKKLKKKGSDPRRLAIQAGDILIMMTAKFARKMLAVIACSLLCSCECASKHLFFCVS